MLHGAPIQILWASNTSPIALMTETNTLAANDWVQVAGVYGAPGANGIWQCEAVTSSVCVLVGSVASGVYTGGGTLTALGSNVVAPSAWYDLARCDKAYIHVWAPPSGATATVTIEGSSQPLTLGPPSGAVILTTVTNPTATGSYYVVPILGNGVRVNVTVYATPAARIYSVLEGYLNGNKVY
jgi:hypothetical protein